MIGRAVLGVAMLGVVAVGGAPGGHVAFAAAAVVVLLGLGLYANRRVSSGQPVFVAGRAGYRAGSASRTGDAGTALSLICPVLRR